MQTNSFHVEVSNANEYNEAVRHADALGFEPVKHRFKGAWQTSDSHGNEAVFVSGSTHHVEMVGRTLFHAEIDGNILGIRPDPHMQTRDPGTVSVIFEEVVQC